MNSIETDVREFLGKHMAARTVASGANLFEAGFMTSLFAARLLSFIETHFEIRVPDEDLEMRNFASISSITNMIVRLRAASTAV